MEKIEEGIGCSSLDTELEMEHEPVNKVKGASQFSGLSNHVVAVPVTELGTQRAHSGHFCERALLCCVCLAFCHLNQCIYVTDLQ